MVILTGSYSTYAEATLTSSLSDEVDMISDNTKNTSNRFSMYTYESNLMMIRSIAGLLFMLFSPYTIFLIILFGLDTYVGLVCFIIILTYLSIICSYKVPNQYSTKGLFNLFGSSISSGLYYNKSDVNICKLLQKCPILTSKEVIDGNLPVIDSQTNKQISTLHSTWWMLTGDMRTLIPFLMNKPKDIEYIRQWIRVPALSRKKIDDRNNISIPDIKIDKDRNTLYEAVALDWAPARNCVDNNSKEQSSKVALLFLAGLTGGSKEGYILDVVNAVNKKGWDSYVMLGRGLAGTPLESGISFHGARIDDIIECAKIIRQSPFAPDKLFLVGISMGAIISGNASIRGDICSYIDGVVCVAATFNTNKNATFEHSRKFWQPFLAHGLKEAFFANEKMQLQLQNKLELNIKNSNSNSSPIMSSSISSLPKINLQNILDRIVDVYDFDCIVVTNLHGYSSVEAYYEAMSPTKEMIYGSSYNKHHLQDLNITISEVKEKEDKILNSNHQSKLTKPCLILHAIDDPILHVDTLPWIDNHKRSTYDYKPVDNIIYLVTSRGGHVGWPVSSQPWEHGFQYISSIVIEFCNAISHNSSNQGINYIEKEIISK